MTNKLNEAAVALGRRGGKKKSEAKTETARENGRLGGRPSLRTQAEQRVNASPKLSQYRAVIMADWPEGKEHWRWVLKAPVSEIVEWAEGIK